MCVYMRAQNIEIKMAHKKIRGGHWNNCFYNFRRGGDWILPRVHHWKKLSNENSEIKTLTKTQRMEYVRIHILYSFIVLD